MVADIGALLKQIRKKKGWSQEEAAHQMHTTQSTISRLEKNLVACEVNFLVRFSKLTNCEDVVIAALFSTDVLTNAIPLIPMIISSFSFIN